VFILSASTLLPFLRSWINILSSGLVLFKHKIKQFEITIADGPSDSFGSLVTTMKDVQQEELRVIQYIINTIEKIKQEFCKHPKKDHEICDGKKYCMNCNFTITEKAKA